MTTGRRGWPNRDPRWSVLENEADGVTGDEIVDGEEGMECLDPVLLAAARELRRPVALDAALDARIMAAVLAEGSPGAVPSGVTAEWRAVSPSLATAAVPPRATPESPAASPLGSAPAGSRPGPARRRAAAVWSWLCEPRPLRVSPLGGLAAAAVVVAVVLAQGTRDGAAVSGPGAAVATSGDPSVAGPAAAGPAAAGPSTVDPSAVADVQVVQFVLVAPGARSVALVGDFNDWNAGSTPLRAAGTGRRVWSVEVPLVPGRHRYAFVVDGEEWVPDPAAPRAPGADFGAPSSVVTVVEHRS